MAEALRRSLRQAKPKKNSEFYYEEDYLTSERPTTAVKTVTWQRSNSADVPTSLASEVNFNNINGSAVWAHKLSFSDAKDIILSAQDYFFSAQDYLNPQNLALLSDSDTSSQCPVSDETNTRAGALQVSEVNKQSVKQCVRRLSSTSEAFLDLEGNFLSAASQTDATDMSGEEQSEVGADKSPVREVVQDKDSDLKDAIFDTLARMKDLTKEVKGIKSVLLSQIDRMSRIESDVVQIKQPQLNPGSLSTGSSGSKPRSSVPQQLGTGGLPRQPGTGSVLQQGAGSLNLPPPVRDDHNKRRKERVEFEKDRTLHILLEQMRLRDQNTIPATSDDFVSDLDLEPRSLRKKMPSKLKEESNLRTALRLEQAGATFPVEDDSNLSGSGMESDSRSSSGGRRKKKVKSGADIRIRPVIKTELWPHTVINEEDGENVTSNDILLSKFLEGYTQIMTSRRGIEAAGRSLLLHAISMVLGCLPWTEARLFHNLVMVKLEQGRIKWDADFTVLADRFIEQKVRQTLKNKAQVAASYNNQRSGNRGQGRGQGRSNGNRGRNSAAFSLVCYQWNKGSCSYGADCKRWHCCRTCAEAGKPGERHKASTCKGKPGEQQSS